MFVRTSGGSLPSVPKGLGAADIVSSRQESPEKLDLHLGLEERGRIRVILEVEGMGKESVLILQSTDLCTTTAGFGKVLSLYHDPFDWMHVQGIVSLCTTVIPVVTSQGYGTTMTLR